MATYESKRHLVDAFQWSGDERQVEDPVWICEAIRAGWATFDRVGTPDVTLLVKQPDGRMERARRGDWIVQLAPGVIAIRTPEIFAATYQELMF